MKIKKLRFYAKIICFTALVVGVAGLLDWHERKQQEKRQEAKSDYNEFLSRIKENPELSTHRGYVVNAKKHPSRRGMVIELDSGRVIGIKYEFDAIEKGVEVRSSADSKDTPYYCFMGEGVKCVLQQELNVMRRAKDVLEPKAG
jgi:hypothetical protein